MIKIIITPIAGGSICEPKIHGMEKRVKIFGITILVKILKCPSAYGMKEWDSFYPNI